MATRTKAKAGTTKTKAKAAAEEPAKRGRRSPLDDLTDRQKEQLAKRVIRLRQNGTPWDGDEGICAQEELITSAGVGRKLLREFGEEGMIRERVVGNGSKKAPAKKAPAKAKPKGKVVVKRGSKTKRANP